MSRQKQPPFNADIVEAAFEKLGAATVAQVVAHTGLLPNAVRTAIRALRAKGRLYVQEWNASGIVLVPVYILGTGEDAIDPRIAKRIIREAHEAAVAQRKEMRRQERERLKAEKERKKQQRDEAVHKKHKTDAPFSAVKKIDSPNICDIAASWIRRTA
jgi:hypothetical protein